ncbi:MAG: TatD family hydrolase [bacterium]
MLVDSHVHLNRRDFSPDLPEVLARAEAAGITGFLNVGYDLDSSEQSVALAARDPRIFASVGVHPHDASLLADSEGRMTAAGEKALVSLEHSARQPGVVAIGEIGLDFYRDLSPRPAQQTAFLKQLQLAERLELPVILHVRNAYAEARAILDTAGIPPRRGVMHAFAGDLETARWACERGLHLGIGGPVTYQNSPLPGILEVVTPDDLLLETDAPWLPPLPFRGKRNEPAHVRLIAEKVASLYGVELTDIAGRTTRNFQELFALDGIGKTG